jgi:large subunit ribosomal protein L15
MAKSALSNLKPQAGSRKRVKRIARGQGSGHGGTSTRGHKGEGARSGTHYRPWFEGGQMPLVRRTPKFGFHSPFRVEHAVVNIETLEKLAAAGKLASGKVTPEILHTVGAVAKKSQPVKILGRGEMKAKLEVTAHAFSKSAAEKIEKAGGKAIIIETPKK